jgi:ABC-2 type transport system permease protein
MALRRVRAGVAASLREFARTPVTLALLVSLPPVVVVGYGQAMAAFPDLMFVDTDPGTLGHISGAVFAAAFLPALIGLFQVISAGRADERLVLAGFSRPVLFLSRVAVVALASVLAACIAVAVVWTAVEPAAPLVAVGVLAAAGGVYGLLGMLVGALIPRELEGSLVLVFLADFDDALSSGLFEFDTDLVELLPLYHPHALFETAVTEGAVDGEPALAVAAYLGVVFLVTLVVYTVLTGERGVGA